MPQNPPPLPDFTRWPSFPFEGDMRVKDLAEPVAVEPPRSGEDAGDCVACNTPDDAYIWVSERWRVRGMDRPTGLPIVLILECRSHLDIGDLPNLLAAELGVMTVRLERAIRSLDGVARVHVNRWGDGSAHLHMWFLARPYGRLQLRGTFLSLWDDLLPVIPEEQWLENLALVAEWLAGFGGRAIAEPAHILWQSPSTFGNELARTPDTTPPEDAWPQAGTTDSESDDSRQSSPASHADAVDGKTRDLSSYATETNANPPVEAATRSSDEPTAAIYNSANAAESSNSDVPGSGGTSAASTTTGSIPAPAAGGSSAAEVGDSSDAALAAHGSSTAPTGDRTDAGLADSGSAAVSAGDRSKSPSPDRTQPRTATGETQP